jgi:hypothetical protein
MVLLLVVLFLHPLTTELAQRILTVPVVHAIIHLPITQFNGLLLAQVLGTVAEL